MLGATMPIGAGEPQGVPHLGQLDQQRTDGSMIALGGVYNLSKRTALYTTYSYISNSGNKSTYNYGMTGCPWSCRHLGNNTCPGPGLPA